MTPFEPHIERAIEEGNSLIIWKSNGVYSAMVRRDLDKIGATGGTITGALDSLSLKLLEEKKNDQRTL